MAVHHNNAVAFYYGLIALFITVIHNVFLLYHVETFVSIYKIDKFWFWACEIIFLVWNSCNDPFFGWLSDKQYLVKATATADVIAQRIKALSICGPLLAVCFMSMWVSWNAPAFQFIVCLCAYDGFLTMVDLHHSALLADLAVSAHERTGLNFYCSLFAAMGSVSVFVSYFMWNRNALGSFQMFCFVLTLISISGFLWSTSKLKQHYSQTKGAREKKQEDEQSLRSLPPSQESQDLVSLSERKALKKFIKNLYGHHNFICFAAMNLLQVFHCHFNSNFFPLFLESLLGDSVSQTACSIILGVSFVAPHINNLYALSLVRRYGVYRVIRGLFVVKLALTLLMAYAGPGNIMLLAVFIASNRVFTEGTCKLLNLVISDLVDEDFVIHHREQAVSALMFGTASLLSKPGQTLAPLIGTWLLATYTGHDMFGGAAGGTSSGGDEAHLRAALSGLDAEALERYRAGVFHCLVTVPAAVAILQLLVWARFSLHGKRLRWVQSVRQGAMYGGVV